MAQRGFPRLRVGLLLTIPRSPFDSFPSMTNPPVAGQPRSAARSAIVCEIYSIYYD
jgi:hypothetical protein